MREREEEGTEWVSGEKNSAAFELLHLAITKKYVYAIVQTKWS